ncbi:YbhB/YbcL family Raf kinase inhibitor-like protein [Anaerolentibacter hominis]|uniref:YbhB/YbcL family Raf kinase inhibitor-like protein n=1 Tax=Anaerolentibacter hominis TaxID=3079009 RepID=UPI0031B7F3FE
MDKLVVSSPCFEDGGLIPLCHTGHGEDRSPELVLTGLSREAVSIAIIMNDMGHPIPAYNHWIIWNIPAAAVIPGNIPHGKCVPSLGGAVQGIGYGRNRYRGPKPPFRWSHVYHYKVYVLDCLLDLDAGKRKKDLLSAMQGHILQQGVLTGHYR